jgi:hypothetical protein
MVSSGRKWWFAAALLGITYYVAIAFYYAQNPFFEDHVGPTIAMLASVFQHGAPVYTTLDAANRYSLLYGPLSYALPGMATFFIGDSILASKLVGMSAGLISLASLIAFTFAKFREERWLVIVVYLLLSLSFQNYTFWNRPDSLMLAGSNLTLLSLAINHPLLAVALRFLGLSLLVNGKLHGALYIVFLVPFFSARLVPAFVQAGLLLCVSLSFPFIIFPQFSFPLYVAWLNVASHHPLSLFFFVKTVWFAAFVLSPGFLFVALLAKRPSWPQRQWLVSLGLGLLSVVMIHIVASKEGAGRHHLIPLIPFVAVSFGYGAARLSYLRSSMAQTIMVSAFLMWIGVLTVMTIPKQLSFLKPIIIQDRSSVIVDVKEAQVKLVGKRVAFGYSDLSSYPVTYYRPMFADVAADYFLDFPALMDMALAGMPLPYATLKKLVDGDYDAFVLPREGEPFSLPSGYTNEPLFGEEFRLAFLAHYRKTSETKFFSIWERGLGVASIDPSSPK